jgi:formate hydrogenlyase subunit 4
MKALYIGLIYIIAAPLLGGLLAGIDRIITARMQRRVGPPVLQPFYDVGKLLQKKTIVVNRLQNPYLICHLLFMIATGFLFFEGSDILLILFVLTLSSVFLVLAAYSTHSAFATIGAERELLLIMAYEPMVLLALVGIYKIAGSFSFYDIIASDRKLIVYLPGIFAGFVYILTMKLRKSPFDISYSHHAHQELVKGLTTDFSGRSIALVEIAHWYENIFLLGFIYLFFSFNPWIAAAAIAGTYLFEIFIDNTFARVKWQLALRSAWIVALLLGGGNLIILYALRG